VGVNNQIVGENVELGWIHLADNALRDDWYHQCNRSNDSRDKTKMIRKHNNGTKYVCKYDMNVDGT
jgi:hypothetical protein